MDQLSLQGSKYLWQLPRVDTQEALSIASRYNVSVPIAHTLVHRGYTSKEALDAYLFTSYERDVAHPLRMKGMDLAIERIQRALAHKENILIFGDYDVDGITATTLMVTGLLGLGASVNFYLPNRVRDGYGLSTKIVERAAQNKYTLIITVDNGITAFDAVERAREVGVDVIITDHHRVHGKVPQAYAIVDPNQEGCDYPCKALAGVGVAFKIIRYLYELCGKEVPAKVYELLLLGTVADVVPLVGENRYWVRECLHKVRDTESMALALLKENAGVTKPVLTSSDIGYWLAPQINALGRLEDPRQAVTFLIGADRTEVREVGRLLWELNTARKEIEKTVFSEIQVAVSEGKIDLSHENIILAASKQWAPGVIGLVASRLMNTYGRPAILLHITAEGMAKGSCRSIPEFNMFDALASQQHLLEHFGGHSMAAGLSIKLEHIPAFKAALEERIASMLTPYDLQQKMVLDAQVTLSDVNKQLVHDLSLMEPFGNANKEPVFYLRNVSLVQEPQLLKDAHVKCKIFADGVIKPLVFFNRPELFSFFQQLGMRTCDVACTIHENYWSGKVSVELVGIDVALHGE